MLGSKDKKQYFCFYFCSKHHFMKMQKYKMFWKIYRTS